MEPHATPATPLLQRLPGGEDQLAKQQQQQEEGRQHLQHRRPPVDAESQESAPILKDGAKGIHRHAAGLDGDELLSPPTSHHFPYIDMTRICCIACVALDHGAPEYGRWNVLFTQNWVLQFLFLVCGVCFGMSRQGLLAYEARLAAYVIVGVLVNWVAWIIAGRDWRHDFFNVVFQLWFVVGLMGYAAVLSPLKAYLDGVRRGMRERAAAPREEYGAVASDRSPEAPELHVPSAHRGQGAGTEHEYRTYLFWRVAAICAGMIMLFLVFRVLVDPLLSILAPVFWRAVDLLGENMSFWGFPTNTSEARTFLDHLCSYILTTCTNIFLIIACPKLFPQANITSWAVILNTYMYRILCYRGEEERVFHGLDLMTIALTCYFLGLRRRQIIGMYLARYWFVVVWVMALVWPVGHYGRFDEHPPSTFEMRARCQIVEMVVVVVWLTAGERLIQPEVFTQDGLQFMNDWALWVFLVHQAVHIVIPPPLNWVVLVGLAPVCYLRRRWT